MKEENNLLSQKVIDEDIKYLEEIKILKKKRNRIVERLKIKVNKEQYASKS